MGYYIDIFDPQTDINKALDELGRNIGKLYAEAWAKNKQKDYDDKPFDLDINTFANMWLRGMLKVFFVYDDQTREAIGFLVGAVFRPLPFNVQVFHIQEYYARGGSNVEQDLFDHVIKSIRILGCDEVWMEVYPNRNVNLGPTWKQGERDFTMRRYSKV